MFLLKYFDLMHHTKICYDDCDVTLERIGFTTVNLGLILNGVKSSPYNFIAHK